MLENKYVSKIQKTHQTVSRVLEHVIENIFMQT